MNIKVLHIVAGDLSGGAARGAYWLHRGLLECGVESKMLIQKADGNDLNVISIAQTRLDKVLQIFRANLDHLPVELYRKRKKLIFSTGLIGFDIRKYDVYQWADIIHLHWINNGMIDVKLLKKIDKPIVWTIRDMWPMTGGCHYSMKCERYKIGCGKCPQLNSQHQYDLSKMILNRKAKNIPNHIKFVGISSWLSEKAKESVLLRNSDVRTIHNNINTKDFFPVDKQVARTSLGICTDKKIILVGAQNVNDFYKGFDKFIKTIRLLDKNKYYLCFFGRLDTEITDLLDFEYMSFGFLHDTTSLRLLYSAADIFVAPSLMDAFGKTLAESMACGTPVVCFNATGPKDIVDHQINGYKAAPFDCSDLANGINWVLHSPDYTTLSQNAREKVLRCFDSKVVAKKYIELYKSVLG